MEALKRLFETYQPQKIAWNCAGGFAYSDGVSCGVARAIREGVGEKWASRLAVDDMIPVKVMELRTPSELEAMHEVADVAYAIIDEMYEPERVTPGVTTTQDLEWFMRQRTVDLGLDFWFEPTMDLERAGAEGTRLTGTIEEGDLLHCDFGIRYMNLCTDTQRLAYVPRAGETEVPSDIRAAMKVNDRFQDIVCENMVEGRTGNEVLEASLEAARAEGIDAMLYSHPCNMYGHGPGPTIGLWSNQHAIPVAGDVPVSYGTTWALELNTKGACLGKDACFIYTEETVLLDEHGVHYLHEGRETVKFIG